MKALVYHGPHHLTVEDRSLPQPGSGEVLVKVEAVGICGSELEGYTGHSSVRIPPLIMGHEFCGLITEVSPDVKGITIGDKVIVNPLISCGKCDRCHTGKPNICRHREIIGIHRPGAFAEYVTVPQRNVYPVPNEMSSSLASLAEPLAVSIHGIKLGLQPFEDLLIFGAGPIGLLTLQVALNMGVRKVLVIDKQEERLNYARQLGAEVATPNQMKEQFDAIFTSIGVDTIIDCVGVQETQNQSFKFINPGGKIIMIGLGHDQSTISMNHLVRHEVKIFGSYTYLPADFEQAIHLLTNGKIKMDDWSISHDLSEGPKSFQSLVERKTKYSKIILKP